MMSSRWFIGGGGGAFPRQALGETACRVAQPSTRVPDCPPAPACEPPERRRRREAPEIRSRRGGPSLGAPDCRRRATACHTPLASTTVIPHPSFGDGKDVGPGSPHQSNLVRFTHEAVERHRVPETELGGEPFELDPMVARPCDVQSKVGSAASRHSQRPDGEPYSFITLQPSNIQEAAASMRGCPGDQG